MHCPFCQFANTKVTDSRTTGAEGIQVRRRRKCKKCGERFTTYERAGGSYPRVMKRDKRRETFSKEKIRRGITLACEKRPVATVMIDKIVAQIAHEALESGKREIATQAIGERVMQSLRVVDQVAYVRFASVYESFEDVQEFKDMIEKLEDDLTPEMLENQLSLLADAAGGAGISGKDTR